MPDRKQVEKLARCLWNVTRKARARKSGDPVSTFSTWEEELRFAADHNEGRETEILIEYRAIARHILTQYKPVE